MNGVAQKTIMLVEDEALIAMYEKLVLERLGYTVLLALSGQKAIATFAADYSIDLVLMDIDLGKGIDGTETARVLLQYRDVPVVFLSSHTEPEIVEKTEIITSYGYISKNSNVTVLQASIKMAFKLFAAKTKVLETNRKLEATLDALPDLFFEVDLDGRYFDVHCPDPLFLFMPVEDLRGSRIIDRLPSNVSDTIMAAIRDAHLSGISRGSRYSLAVPAGLRWFEISVSKIAGSSDDPHFILLCRDITEQVRIDEDLQESKRHAESLLNVSAEIIMAVDAAGIITLLNDNGHRVFGYEPGELIGKKWADVGLVGEARTEVVEFLDDLLHGGNDTLVAHENLVRLKSGELRTILWHNTVLRDRNGAPSGILSSGEDISRYKELEERYRTIIEVSPDIIAVTDLRGRIVMCSPKALPMFGYDSVDEQLGHPVTDFMVPEDVPKALGNLQRMAAGEVLGVVEYRGLRKDGGAFDMEINGEFIRDRDGKPEEILFIIRDTTARKRLISNYKLLFDLSPVGIGLFDHAEGTFLDANPAFVDMLGYEKQRLLQLSYFDLTPSEYQQATKDHVSGIMKNGRVESYKKEYIRKDGTRLPVAVRIVGFLDDEKRKVVLGLVEDITERQAAEKKVSALLQEKDLILKEVHHRIKNNFAVIRGLLQMQAQDAHDAISSEAFRATERRVQSMTVLYEKLYESSSFTEASLRDYVPALTKEIVSNFPDCSRIRIVSDVADFRLDAKRLQSLGILLNELVTNSMKYAFAGRDTGTIFISAERIDTRVVVSIGDDGIGLPEGVEPGASSGFGLTLVSMLAEQLHGIVKIERGKGTRVLVEFEV
ncbi:MAG: hypothetical protein A2Y38_18470 [Spirochaetes bacterium GWB1_59_5]|nr:MAG: hypothetical protein A2Y38_18470 [Spirochaetes bacterium GWB1_59_5]